MPNSGVFPRNDRTRVLFADPSVDVRRTYCMLATREGFDVELARDGGEAIAIARKRPPAIAVLETRLPKADGIDVLNALRASEHTRSTRVVLVYDFGEHLLEARVDASGCDARLVRPYPYDALFRLLGIFRIGCGPVRCDDAFEDALAYAR